MRSATSRTRGSLEPFGTTPRGISAWASTSGAMSQSARRNCSRATTLAAATAMSLSALCRCSTTAFLPRSLSERRITASVGANWSTTTRPQPGCFSSSSSMHVPCAHASRRLMFLIFA